MRLHRVAQWIGGAGLAFALQACVVEPTTPVNPGYGYGYASGPSYQAQASVSVGTPSPYTVSSMPPEPLYESMSASPGYGYAWIDGYWHWNSYEWVWVSGRWERSQEGYVYVEPYYDNSGGAYVYTPGYWAPHDRVPHGWQVRDHRDGRPAVVAPPSGWHNSNPPARPGAGYGGGYRPPPGNGYPQPGVRPTNTYQPGRPIGPQRPTNPYPEPPRGQSEPGRPGIVQPQEPPRGQSEPGRPGIVQPQ
jgi:hypothetical protein